MKKRFLSLILTLSILLISLSQPMYVSAATTNEIPCPFSICTLAAFIDKVASLVQPVAVIALIACIIGAGFVRLTSSGDSEKEQKSIKILTSAAIGFAIIVLAPLIVRVLTTLLGVPSLLTP